MINSIGVKDRAAVVPDDLPETLEEAQAVFGDVTLRFSRYYKHQFTFNGKVADGVEIVASFKGVSSIYREVVTPDTEYSLSEHWWSKVQLLRDDELLAEWCER